MPGRRSFAALRMTADRLCGQAPSWQLADLPHACYLVDMEEKSTRDINDSAAAPPAHFREHRSQRQMGIEVALA